tara:strand:+ start:512 stop:1915 length:1404 start_codon:yes stop_codon:yes gene_type:complete
MKEIVVAILAKDKEYCLDFYLTCILNQTYDKKKIRLWIRTNDNKDNTQGVLDRFVKKHGKKYLSVYYNSDPISDSLKEYNEHEWNSDRFNILGAIRQESINYAIEKDSHYFVADCDNFITNDTIEHFYNLKYNKFVGPMLKLSQTKYYANFHNVACPSGYFAENDMYYNIWSRKVKGLIKVDTLHCTYFINNNTLKDVTYNDGSGRYEYAILAHALRKKGINQYMDNTRFFGFLFLNDQIQTSFDNFINENWLSSYKKMLGDGYYDFVEIGTSDFDALMLRENPGKGISVEAIPYYSNKLPDIKGVKKINVAVSDTEGEISIHWLKPEIIKKYNLPSWVKGSNCVDSPHLVVIEQMEIQKIKKSYEEIATISKIPKISWKKLAKDNNINGVKLIKIDTEGHEHVILKNMLEDLKERSSFRPENIFFENNRLANESEISKIVQGFKDLGYTFKKWDNMDSQLIYNQDV